jgi:hypothetical protein
VTTSTKLDAVGRRLETPRAAGAGEIAHFYLDRDAGRVALVGLYLVPFAGIVRSR